MFYPVAVEILWNPVCSSMAMVPPPIHPSAYTSLRDLLPAAIVNSPRPMTPAAHWELYYGSEISIRNRLVKMAAWAYLKPTSTLMVTADQSFLRRFLRNSVVAAIVHSVDRLILLPLSRAFKWLFKS
nr:uncharacterized protein LOC109181112 [Ipomoea batatas]